MFLIIHLRQNRITNFGIANPEILKQHKAYKHERIRDNFVPVTLK